MMVYCKDRSIKLPRKRKQRFEVRSSACVKPYRADDHRTLPSVFERRCARGTWQSKQRDEDEQEAARILEELCS